MVCCSSLLRWLIWRLWKECWRLELWVSPLGKGTTVGLWAVVSLLSPAYGGAAMERGGVAGSVEVLRLCCCWWLVRSVMAAGRLRKERTM
jgi:hypothetical protein